MADKDGLTLMIGPDSTVHLLANPVFGGNVKHLVESECELLLVDRYISNGDDGVRIDVFRLDEKEKKWVKLANLGDRVLFLGEDCAFSTSASDLCIGNGNCVIFRDYVLNDFHSTEVGNRVFHLDQRRISPLSDFPIYSKLFWPPPEWVGLH